MLQKILMAAMGLLPFISATAQPSPATNDPITTPAATESEKKTPVFTITGSADAYYRYDLANTNSNSFTSFTQTHNTFSLGMASVKFEHKTEKVGVVLDLGFGPRAKDFSYTDEGVTQAIKQLYVSYSPTSWLKFTLGTWGTHIGYELLDPQLNRNYSMSYMFTNGPFSHTGLKAEVAKGKHGFMIGLANATDYRVPPTDQVNKKFFLFQYSLAATDNIKFFLNYAGGQNPDTTKTNQFDAVVTAKINDKFNIGFNATLNATQRWDGTKNLESQSWSGAALYLNLDPKNWFGLTLRSELFNDKHQFKVFSSSAVGGSIFSNTLSANFKTSGFIFIPEFRVDHASKNVLFTGKDGMFKSSAASLIFAAIYSF